MHPLWSSELRGKKNTSLSLFSEEVIPWEWASSQGFGGSWQDSFDCLWWILLPRKGLFCLSNPMVRSIERWSEWLVLKCRANRRSHFRRSALTIHVSFSSVSSRQVLRNRPVTLWNSQSYRQQHDDDMISVCKVKCNETNNRWWKSKYFPPLTGCPWGPDSSGTCGQWKEEKVTNAWCGCLDWSKRWRT